MKITHIYLDNFRNFKNIDISLGRNITVIAGINGIGKSNILGIISAANGVGKKGLFRKNYQPQFDDYFNISKDEPFRSYEVSIEYDKASSDGKFYLTQELRCKDDTKSKRGIRLIPRAGFYKGDNSIKKKDMKSEFNLKESRLYHPTIYMGLSRLYPLGEANYEIKEKNAKNVEKNSKYYTLFQEIYEKIMCDSINNDDKTVRVVNKTNKKNQEYMLANIKMTSPDTISAGQDNLNYLVYSIIELIYFKDTYSNYDGSILCIDEIDASLHPSILCKLLDVLKDISETYNIQMIMTTHSMIAIEKILELENKRPDNYKLIYLKDKNFPRVSKYKNIDQLKSDLFEKFDDELVDTIKIYIEDDMTLKLFEALIKIKGDMFTKIKNYKFEYIVLNVGCKQLIEFPRKDPYFLENVIVVDGDAKLDNGNKQLWKEYMFDINVEKNFNQVNGIADNIIFLPKFCPPEVYAFGIMYEIVHNPSKYESFWKSLEDDISFNSLTTDILKNQYSINKDTTFDDIHSNFDKQIDLLINSNMLSAYYENTENIKELDDFINRCKTAVDAVEKKHKRRKKFQP